MAHLFRSTLRYPIEGAARSVLLASTLALTVALSLLPQGLCAIAAVALLLAVFGFHASYLFDVLRATAMDEDDPPEWPEPRDLVSCSAEAFLHGTIVAGAAFAPGVLTLGILGANSLFPWLLLTLGAVYFPTAISCFGLTGDFASLSPLRVARCIAQVPAAFLGVSMALVALLVMSVPLRLVGEVVPVLGAVGLAALWSYASLCLARVLGVIHREYGSSTSALDERDDPAPAGENVGGSSAPAT